MWGWGDGSQVESIDSSSRKPKFDSRSTNGPSQPPDPRDPTPSFGFWAIGMHVVPGHIYTQKTIHTSKDDLKSYCSDETTNKQILWMLTFH